jgi:RNA polymerase sigma factor (sigma-70 family)
VPPLTHLLHRLRRLAAPPAADADAVLLDRFVRRRDEAAFAELVAHHGPLVYGACVRVLGDAHAAEDAFQATFLVLARRAGSVGRPASLAGWLYGVARRVALKARAARRRDRCRALPAANDPFDPHPDPLAQLTARDLLAVLEDEVGRLPEGQRLAVALCCLEGLSQEEVARRMGWTPGAVKGRLERGRARLHARLARRGLTLAAALAAAELARGRAAGWPASLLGATVNAAALAAARGAVQAGAVSANVAFLTEEVVRTMTLKKVTLTAALVLAVACAASTAALAYHAGGAGRAGQAVRPGPVARAPAPAPPLKEGTVRGVVERVVDDGDGKALLLTCAVKVPVNERTEYVAETGLDAAMITLPDVLGKEVVITVTARDGKPVAASVWVPRMADDVARSRGATKLGVLHGVVERLAKRGRGEALVLADGTWVATDERTDYCFETFFDAKPAQPADVVGKAVTIITEKRDGQTVAAGVMIDLIQPGPDVLLEAPDDSSVLIDRTQPGSRPRGRP